MKKYNVILADPPWSFRAWSSKGMGRSAEQHYPTMRLEDIKALPVSDLAAGDCVLFLWATFPMLKEALEVIDTWGFTYKTVAFTWVKENRKSPGLFWGLGYWTRANAEVCLLATGRRFLTDWPSRPEKPAFKVNLYQSSRPRRSCRAGRSLCGSVAVPQP